MRFTITEPKFCGYFNYVLPKNHVGDPVQPYAQLTLEEQGDTFFVQVAPSDDQAAKQALKTSFISFKFEPNDNFSTLEDFRASTKTRK